MSRLQNWWHNTLDAEGRNTYKQIATGLGFGIALAIFYGLLFPSKLPTNPSAIIP